MTDTDQLCLNHLRSWVVYSQEKLTKHNGEKLKDTMAQMYGKHILVFCHCMEQEEIIENPITTHFKLPRAEKQFIPTLVASTVDKLLAACEYGDDRQATYSCVVIGPLFSKLDKRAGIDDK